MECFLSCTRPHDWLFASHALIIIAFIYTSIFAQEYQPRAFDFKTKNNKKSSTKQNKTKKSNRNI